MHWTDSAESDSCTSCDYPARCHVGAAATVFNLKFHGLCQAESRLTVTVMVRGYRGRGQVRRDSVSLAGSLPPAAAGPPKVTATQAGTGKFKP